MDYDFSKAETVKQELQDTVMQIANTFADRPEDIVEYLKFQTKFYNYSSRNCLLIYKQNPGAIFCNSFKAIKDMGYAVKKGEHGMKILVPTLKTYLKIGESLVPLSQATEAQKQAYKVSQIDSVKKLFFKVGTVFDIAQTTCPVQDYPQYLDLGYSSARHAQLYKSIKNYCEQELNCTVNENNLQSVALRGYFLPSTNSISISGNFNDTTRLSILTHELGHAILHKSPETEKPTVQTEFEADAVSIMLHTYMGIEIAESQKRHISDTLKAWKSSPDFQPEKLTESLKQAHDAYQHVVKQINQDMEPILKNEATLKELKQFVEQHKSNMQNLENERYTVVINAFAGPGAGKTTSCLEITEKLKKQGFVAEYVQEYAKELVWDNKLNKLDGSMQNQFEILKEQVSRIDRLQGKVDFIVTDSPVLLNAVYLKKTNSEYVQSIRNLYGHLNNYNYFVERNPNAFEKEGRIHNLSESLKIDKQLKDTLNSLGLQYTACTHDSINNIVSDTIRFRNQLLGSSSMQPVLPNQIAMSNSNGFIQSM